MAWADGWLAVIRVLLFSTLVFLLAYNNMLTWETALAIIAGVIFPTANFLDITRKRKE
jgi:hypothetical protein